MSGDVLATFDSTQEYVVQLVGSSTVRVRIIAARTGESGQILALIAKTWDDGLDVVLNWDNILYVRVRR